MSTFASRIPTISCERVQINSKSMPTFLGCVGLRLEEVKFQIDPSIAERPPKLLDVHKNPHLNRLVSLTTLPGRLERSIKAEDICVPINWDDAGFICAVTGASHSLHVRCPFFPKKTALSYQDVWASTHACVWRKNHRVVWQGV